MEECVLCGSVAIHFPVVGFFGDVDPYCGYCFHGAPMEYAAKHEGCIECQEKLEELQNV